jgi:hypothetical protein
MPSNIVVFCLTRKFLVFLIRVKSLGSFIMKNAVFYSRLLFL